MAVYKGSQQIGSIYHGSKKIAFVYHGSQLIFGERTKTFNVSSGTQSWKVPGGVKSLTVDCVASRGCNNGSTVGGNGGRVQCTLKVTAGQTLYFTVGAIPTVKETASYNASDIRIGGSEYSNRVIVAGGGGNASSRNAAGGAGGGLTGRAGSAHGNAGAGQGGSQSAGGAGGTYVPISIGHSHGGNAGVQGTGGAGGSCGYCGTWGAGGAGYYGGGSGGAQWNKNGAFAAAGGGGSSYTKPELCSEVVHTQGYRNGAGYITITLNF